MTALNYEPGQRLRTIRLYGKLGARFGRVHHLAVASASEACRALAVLLPGFERFLFEAKDQGMTFSVFHGKRNISEAELRDPPGRAEIRIAPVIAGSKQAGLLQTVVGAVLIAVGSYTGQTWLVQFGIGIALGGVSQMLTKNPTGLSTQDDPDNKPSYSFNSPVNTQAQGNPVPLGYGRMIVGSAVGSAGIYAEDQT